MSPNIRGSFTSLSDETNLLRNQVPRAIVNSNALSILYGEAEVISALLHWLDTCYSGKRAENTQDFQTWVNHNQIFKDDVKTLVWIKQAAVQLPSQGKPPCHSQPFDALDFECRIILQILTRCTSSHSLCTPVGPNSGLTRILDETLGVRKFDYIKGASFVAEPRLNTIRPEGTLTAQFCAVNYCISSTAEGFLPGGEGISSEEKHSGWMECEWLE